jgi:hypothetical protein
MRHINNGSRIRKITKSAQGLSKMKSMKKGHIRAASSDLKYLEGTFALKVPSLQSAVPC